MEDIYNKDDQAIATEVVSPKPSLIVRIILILILVFEILALPGWLVLSALSGMGFDSGFSWTVVLFMLPLWLYPIFLVVFTILAYKAFYKTKHLRAIFYMILPWCISLGWIKLLVMTSIM